MLNRLEDRLKNLLATNSFTIGVLVVAIAGRLLQLLYFFNIRSDRSFQLLATTNLLKGYGISLAEVNTADLSHIIYTPLINWPPAYSLIIAPLYVLSGHNYLIAALTLDILAAIVLILISRAILKLLHVSPYAISLYTITSGLFIYPFYFISSSDSIAVTVFIIAVYYNFQVLIKERASALQMIILAFSLLVCGALKYLFIPMVFVPPFYLLIKGIVQRKYIFKKTAIIAFIIICAGLSILFIYQLNRSGSVAYVSSGRTGFFPQNLLNVYPFIVAAFINPATITTLFSTYYHASPLFAIIQFFNILLFILVCYSLIRIFIKRKLPWLVSQDFYVFSVLVSLSLLLLLASLSLRISTTEELPGNWWTFIQEPRYYGLPIVLIQLTAFILLSESATKLRRRWRYIFYVLFTFLLLETLHGIVFSTHRLFKLHREEYSWQADLHFQKYADQLIRNLRREYNLPIVVYASSYYMANRVGLYSHVPILYINSGRLNTTKPVILLEILNKADALKSTSFTKSRTAGYYNGLYFYAHYVTSR